MQSQTTLFENTAPISTLIAPIIAGAKIPLSLSLPQPIKWVKGLSTNGFTIDETPGLIHCIPISGGADSSALALVLHKLFPHIPFQMVMSDTGAEADSTYQFLDLIEQTTGSKITRIKGELDLFELIEKFGGYLPGAGSRWCTRLTKLVPFQEYFKTFNGAPVAMYIGIRSDESSRIGFSIEGVETIFPYIEMGWDRNDVFGLLSRSIGVPSTYQTRTRSGCTVCPFTRRQEVLGLYQSDSKSFTRGMLLEKLSEEDALRHGKGVPLWKDSGIAQNWCSFPMPTDGVDLTGLRNKKGDLFGTTGVFVGIEFFMGGMPGLGEFVWHQRLVSYSPTLPAIRTQLDDRYQHLLAVSEVYEMSPADVRTDVRFAIWFIEMPSDVLDVAGPGGKSYTWKQGESYAQVQHISDWATRALHAEHLKRVANQPVKSELTVQYEWKQSALQALAKLAMDGAPLGDVVAGMWHTPKETLRDMTVEEEASLMPCTLCNV